MSSATHRGIFQFNSQPDSSKLSSRRTSLALVLVFQSEGRLVAHFCRTEILDGAGIYVACVLSPFLTLRSELEEGCAIQIYKSFLDNGLHFAVTALHVHHHGDGDTAGNPLHRRTGEVAHARHVACHSGTDEACGVETEGVAVVGIEVRGVCAAAFVTEEVVLGSEFAVVFALFLKLCKAFAHHFGEELLCFDKRNLNVAVGVAVEAELTSHTVGKAA